MASLNHNFRLSERGIFLQRGLDSSGKTGGDFLVFLPVGLTRQHSGVVPDTLMGRPLRGVFRDTCATQAA
jgi:hypothetical protein